MPKNITSDEILELPEKLRSGRDITEDEANSIKKLFTNNMLKTKLNDRSSKFDYWLERALSEWYGAVADALYAGRTGNFANTIYLWFGSNSAFFNYRISLFLANSATNSENIFKIAHTVCLPQKTGEIAAEKSSAKFMFFSTEGEVFGDRTSKIYGFRFDFYGDLTKSDLYPFVRNYVPIVSPGLENFNEHFYKIQNDSYVSKQNLKKYIIPAAVRSSGMDTALLKLGTEIKHKETYFGSTVLCAQEKDVPLILSWAEVPVEDIITELFLSGKITRKDVIALMDEERSCFFRQETISEGAEIMKKLAGIRKEIEEDDSWIDAVR